MPNLHPNEFNWNLLNIPGDLVDMHRKSWLVFSVCADGGGMVTPSRYHNIGSSDYNLTPSSSPTSTLPLSQSGTVSTAVWGQHSVVHVYLFTYSVTWYHIIGDNAHQTLGIWYSMPSSRWTLNHVCMVLLSLIRRQRGRAWSTWTRAPSPDLSPLWPRPRPAVDIPACSDTGQWDAANNCIAHYSVSTRSHLNPGFAFTAHCSKIVSTFSAIFYKFSRNNKQSKALFNEQTTDCLRRWIDN